MDVAGLETAERGRDAGDDAPAERAPARRPATKARKRRVLVVDDDLDMRRLVAMVLRAAGHVVVEARNGVELLQRIDSVVWSDQRDPFDVIVTDVNMPGLSGIDALAAIRAGRWTTPVILITAYDDESIRAEARELGAVRILEKPLDLTALRSAVQAVC